MLPTKNGSVRLFRLLGIDVYVHWLWFVVAVWRISTRDERYSSVIWDVVEYLALFLIVLMHEFGHALACRSVGGQANQIILWLLGGVAYVSPPQRPGAVLWSIAAGPLVNVVLLPIFGGIWFLSRSLGWPETMPNLYELVLSLCIIDIALLCFNMLPVYPLDGGQILQALLWFVVGQARSLMIVSVVGILGVATLFVVALKVQAYSNWLIITAVFVLMSCWRGLMRARALGRLAKAPQHETFACPSCRESPPQGEFWRCNKCRTVFDTFVTRAACPQCGTQFPATTCVRCGRANPIDAWMKPLAS
jgi:Zn-dependent protease